MALNQTRKRLALDPWDIGFGVVVFIGALLALLVWFPADIPTGFLFINTIGREEPGDAFFPILLAITLALLSLIQIVLSVSRARSSGDVVQVNKLSLANLRFLALFLVITFSGLTIMHWLGPLVVSSLNAFGILDGSYRQHTDTAPYKYIGYVVGGFSMTLTLIAWIEGRIRRTSVITVLITLTLAILIFDIALRNVLLPPNADF